MNGSNDRIKKQVLTALWLSILCVYWIEIIRINFSRNPLLYCADMYTDMMYSVAAWQKKSIFPEGWVFGNQYYSAATPVLAALILGFTDDPCIAMGLASTCMGLWVVFSFHWMLKPIFPPLYLRLAAIVLFMTGVLWAGDAVYTVNGWQLFFTMCSYYACYAINAFLAIGCFLRRHCRWSPGFWIIWLLTCVFSFGTGIQSLRQTAITVIPIFLAAGWETAHRIRQGKPFSSKSLLLTGTIALSNLTGVLYAGALSVPKHEIFGSLSLSPVPDLVSAVGNILRLFGGGWILGLVTLAASCFFLISGNRKPYAQSFITFLFLCMAGTAVIFAIDSFTTMHVRSIYYFLLLPMAAVVIVYCCPRSKTVIGMLAAGILLLSLVCGRHSLQSLPVWQDDHPLQAVRNCLEENRISVLFTQWNLGGKIAIASDFRIRVGFWDAADDVFESVEYLCDPEIFDTAPDQCAYLVSGVQNLSLAQERARAKQADIIVLEYFPNLDLYLFISNETLMG